MTPATPSPQRLISLVQGLEQGLLERDFAARLTLLAVLAGEHVLLIGPPGTAKSDLARRLHRAFEGAPYFERLLTRFSTPEELFGPLSLKALEDDRYERLTEGFLPAAGMAFLDEVFKANSAILNALLTLLNEREFDNGRGRVAVPLISVIAASNEVPVDDALLAFYDRFLVRLPVHPVSDAAFGDLLRLEQQPPPRLSALAATEREALVQAAASIELSPQALAACQSLRAWLQERRWAVSDRRWRRWIGLMRTAAFTEGRHQVDAMDLWTAPYVVSPSPEHSSDVARWFAAEVLQAIPHDTAWMTRAVEAFEKQAEIETSAPPADESSDGAGKLALARAIGRGDDEAQDAGPLRFVSEQLEASLQRHYSSVHVATRVAQVEEILAQVSTALADISTQHHQLEAALARRFWVPPSLGSTWLGALQENTITWDTLRQRLLHCRQAFAALPVDDHLAPVRPPAIDLPSPIG